MKIAKILSFIAFISFCPAVFADGSGCFYVYTIQNKFLKNHILFSRHTKEMEQRSLTQFIKTLDPEKIYFLQSDIKQIKRKNRKLFHNLKRQNCSGLYFVYDIYKKRVLERTQFALKYLENFKLDKKTTYILDPKNRKRLKTAEEANKFMKRHLQYQGSNVFLAEEDMEKTLKHLKRVLETTRTRVTSWKPHLNKREQRLCQSGKKRRDFKTCKPLKWLALYLDSYAQSLDSHSSYLDTDDMEEFKISMELKLEGIGATLSSRFGYTVVEDLIEGGAALRAGQLKVKDKILAVGQTKDKIVNIFGVDLQDVVSLIRGKKGTPVYLKILREKKRENTKVVKEIFTVRIIRDTVNLKEKLASLDYINKKINGRSHKIALIHVPSFYGSSRIGGTSVSRDVKKLLKKAGKAKASAVVLDLSGNRGGPLDEAVDLAGLFFAKGHVVKQSERYISHYRILSDRDKSIIYKGPLVILVNRLSASASEIVSGTLQDYNRAVVVGGDHTFGKGSVQSVEFLPFNLGAIKTTIGLYFIPSGQSTQKNGVYSDIVFPSILNIEDLGEKSLDYALPKQQIKPFKSTEEEIFSDNEKDNWQPVSKETIAKLKNLSENRISKSTKFQDIKKKLKKFKEKTKKKKVITIAEVLKRELEKEDIEEEADDEPVTQKQKKEKYLSRPDVNEAVNIAADLAAVFGKEKPQHLSRQ